MERYACMRLVSIIMPVYNVEEYIDEAIESILKQTYKNFECIIIDDCSTDGTVVHLEKYAELDSRIRIIKNAQNLKICLTMNKGLAEATGEFILRMDGDDISEPERIEKLIKLLDENPEIALVGSQILSIDENGGVLSHKKYPISNEAITKGNRYISSVPHFWLARKEVYDVLEGYRNIPYAEDYDFLLRGQLCGFKYMNSNEFLYRCRLRKGNTTSANGLLQRKTVHYVRELNKREKQEKIFLFDRDELNAKLICSEKEKQTFIKGNNYLNKAVTSRKIPKKIFYLTCAFVNSRYSREYIIEAIVFRVNILLERWNKK